MLEPLNINEVLGTMFTTGSFADLCLRQKRIGNPAGRSYELSLETHGFSALYLANPADLRAIRDWINTALAELPDEEAA